MKNFYLFIICLFSVVISSYLPMKKKDIGYEDNVCAYTYSTITYVKPCKDDGKYCKEVSDLGICQDIPTKITLLGYGEKCNHDYECEKGLNCFGTCTTAGSSNANACGTNYSPLKRENKWECIHNSYKDFCTYVDTTTTNGVSMTGKEADYFQVCGAIDFYSYPGIPASDGNIYLPTKISSNYIGTQKAGTFVQDKLACESGFALYFYYNGSGGTSKDPYTGSNTISGAQNDLQLMCVNPEDIEYRSSDSCTIKYDEGKLYNVDYLPSENSPPYIKYRKHICEGNKYLKTKLELFKKYIEVFTKTKQEECAKEENYNEPRTCNNNEIRKWFYLYENPEVYINYYDDDLKYNDVLTFLIQQEYPSYQISRFINLNYFIYLLIALLSL